MSAITVRENELLVWDSVKYSMQQKLSEFVQYFQMSIPATQGQVRAYIDPTAIFQVIMEADSPDDVPDIIVDQAKVPIDIDDGILVVEGIPFWERLEGEPVPYYKLFKEYRDMKYYNTTTNAEDEVVNVGRRSLAQLSEECLMPGRHLNVLAKAYHWVLRAKAFDNYKTQEKQLIRQRDIENLESKHAQVSNKLLDQAVDYLINHPEQLSPKVAVDLAALSMRAGRLSLGLNPDKPGSDSPGGSGRASVNIINQNTAVGADGNLQQVNDFGNLSSAQQQAQTDAQDIGHLQSILHVLNQSGAFSQAQGCGSEDDILEEDIID